MKNASMSFLAFALAACGPTYENTPSKTEASASSVTVKADAGTAAPRVSGATRHLPGTIITTATGKYYYLVQSDGSMSAFASSGLVTASGYKLGQAVVTTADELRCYDRGDDITEALPIPPTGVVRDGTLLKEENRSAVYAVSDGVAWPVLSQGAYDLAGYDDANIQRIPAGSLAGKVTAVGDCAAGIACLDEKYGQSCAKDQALQPIVTATATATSTGTSAVGDIALTQRAAAGILRHLPGTVITAGTGKYYLVNDDGTISQFASASLVKSSGYADNMVITVSSEELGCYGLGNPITSPLPIPDEGMLRDGVIVKDKNPEMKAVYIISGGIAWPVVTGSVFEKYGYTFDATIFLEPGDLPEAVLSIGDCALGINCLTQEYGQRCQEDGNAATGTVTAIATQTQTGAVLTQTATVTAATVNPTVTNVNTATQTVTSSAAQTATLSSAPTGTTTTTVTATATSVQAAVTATSTAIVTATSVSTGTQTQASTLDLSWVYKDEGSKLCLNAAYFTGNEKAVLLIWSGPGADANKGSVVLSFGGRYCWDFMNREKGLYYFWADVPDSSCSGDICSRDSVPGNGAMYMTAPKATPIAHEWLACQPTGCDGAAYWDGNAWTPMGG